MPDVRPYRSTDAAACCRVINTAIQQMDGLNDAARQLIAAKNVPGVLDAELGPLFTVVVESGDRLLGVGALDGAEIRRVYVDPAAQRQGIGDALMEALEAEARRRGGAEVRLDASPSSVAFYERLAYVAEPEVGTIVGDAQFTYVPMRKRLA